MENLIRVIRLHPGESVLILASENPPTPLRRCCSLLNRPTMMIQTALPF